MGYPNAPDHQPEDATKAVNFWLDQGVDNFKAYMFLTRAELAAAIQAAHKRGADLGIDDLEHGLFVDTEFTPGKKT